MLAFSVAIKSSSSFWFEISILDSAFKLTECFASKKPLSAKLFAIVDAL